MLTFNISTKGFDLPNDFPYQIFPSKGYLSGKLISWFHNKTNPDIVIHVNCILRPFSNQGEKHRYQLKNYVSLAKKLGSKHILCHLPNTEVEFKNIEKGYEILKDEIYNVCGFDGEILLEIPSWRECLINSFKNMDPKERFIEYFTPILTKLKDEKRPIRIILDTAHLYNNGCNCLEDFKFIVKFLRPFLSEYIHLNGDQNEPYTNDIHIPFFMKEGNHMAQHMKDYDEVIRYIINEFKILICENNFTKCPCVNEYFEYAKKEKIPIIPQPKEGKYHLV